MELSTNQRNLGKVAGTLGLLQGLAWAVMSLAAIILHNWSPTLEDGYTTYTRFLELLLYTRFIQDTDVATNFIIRPFDFTIFMWIYFIMSIGWVAISIDQLTAIHYEKRRQKIIIFLWGVVTLITCLIDLILTCLLARDYANCHENSSEITLSVTLCYLATGIVMTIAARGYTLWMVNVVFSFTMLYVSIKIKNKDKLTNWLANHRIPRLTVPKSSKTTRSGKVSPNFLRNESPLPSFLNESYKFDTEDNLYSFQGRGDKFGDESNVPSFLSRGDRFSY